MKISWWYDDGNMVKNVWQTDRQTEGRTDGRTDWTSHIAAWSQLKIAIWGWQTPQLPRPEKAPKLPRTYVEKHVKTYICTKFGGFNLNKSIGCLRLINPIIINQNHPTWPNPPHPCTPTPHPTSNPTAQHGLIDFPVAHHVSHCETVYAPFQLHGWAPTTTKVP